MAATSEFVIVSDRELNDTADVFRCLKAADGKEVWSSLTPAPGNLDYGNSPRTTPLIHNGLVYLLGALGDLSCVELATGKSKWALNVRDEFEPEEARKWGVCDSPLIVDGKLIVAPGAKEASLVALDPKTGKVVWKAPGKAAGYGSFIAAKLGGTLQIVGHDAETLGGWDVKSGKRLWTLSPERRGDFNVPTPIVVGEKLLVTTENNGTRLFAFKADGTIEPKPVATHKKFGPDSHTPVVAGSRLFGVWNRLYCLDLENGLKELYDESESSYSGYCSAVATETRVLVTSKAGELILLDATAKEYSELGRLAAFGKGEKGVFSHPAFVGTRVYVRGSRSLLCIDLSK